MKPSERDLGLIWDMHTEIKQIMEFIEDVSYSDFIENNMIRYEVERSLLILGEADNHVSEPFRDLHPEIPWHQIVGQRNVLAHEYGDVNVDRIWATITNNLPHLKKNLAVLLDE